MSKRLTLYARFALVTSLIASVAVTGFFFLSLWSSEQHHKELTQKLHGNLSQYVLDHLPGPLFIDANSLTVNKKTLKSIAMNTMMINPSVEVYLLDRQGNILGHALPEASVDGGRVAIEPIQSLLSGETDGAILGDNPRDPEKSNIFSVAPVLQDGVPVGYLYIILASQEAASLSRSLQDSHVTRLLLAAFIAFGAFFILSAAYTFRHMTRPLRQVAGDIRTYRTEAFAQDKPSQTDEVAEIAYSFQLMRERIQNQFDQLAENDRLRRELVSNISHDLRTPLASMQGYLETLLIKADSLDKGKQQQYLNIAHRHSKHLSDMVAQLFELSKLEAGRVEPVYELFSLTELAYDVVQDFELKACDAGIRLKLVAPESNILVNADISLMQRVLGNLVSNALAHTPSNGRIDLILEDSEGAVSIKVKDSGVGIAEQDIPYVFERFYQAREGDMSQGKKGAGLGLSIVKKILDLHGSLITVSSGLQQGTEFSFSLPRAA